MDNIVEELKHWCPEVFVIQEDHSALFCLKNNIIRSLVEIEDFEKHANNYCNERDHSGTEDGLRFVKGSANKELVDMFKDDEDIEVILMSSYGARMHLQGFTSDIDFGVMVDHMTDGKTKKYSATLKNAGYKKASQIKNTYIVFQKEYNGIVVEAKLRDRKESEDIVLLHWFLDNYLDENVKKILTYAKALVKDNKLAYGGLKYLIYCGYMAYLGRLKSKMMGR